MISNKQTYLYTLVAMIAFAANSVLSRLALTDIENEPAAFTLVRLFSGALMLTTLVLLKTQSIRTLIYSGSWLNSFYLFLYAVTFSFAYLFLDTATGALILFASVQVSILLVSWLSGERFSWPIISGLVLCLAGFTWLMLPGASQPSLLGFGLMLTAGLAWAAYTLGGRGTKSPLNATQGNFVRATLLGFVSLLWFVDFTGLTSSGFLLAVSSGALASGAGYAIWYSAVGGLSRLSAGVVQLSVPVIAAIGGIMFVGESITLTFALASSLILLGIGVVVYQSSTDK